MLAPRLLATARTRPDAIAIVDGERRIGYGAFAEQAQRFAGLLATLAVAPGERISIVLPNGIEAALACYGSWLAGCIAVPLNAQARGRELAAWLGHATPRVVVHEADNTEVGAALAGIAPAPIRIATGPARPPQGTLAWQRVGEAAPVVLSADRVAAILYTSGTTGRPKGVTLTHANFAANVEAIVAYLALGADDSTVSALPFYYSYGASVLHTHLAVGGRMVLESNMVFPQLVVEAIERERVTGFSGVPSTFSLLLDRVPLVQHDLSSLRYLTQAGGAMPAATVRRLRDAIPQARLFVMYGQTEATARLAWLPPERLDDKPGSAGKAIAGVRIEVRGEAGHALPAGMPGEVWVRGGNVMAGYWRDPAATALVLHDGWLRTGDMGHLDTEGYLYLDGRRSDMIKTGAHRVHPLEIEEVLCELGGVREAAAVGIPDPTLGQVIKAFLVVADAHALDADAVRAHCRAYLAPHKVPRRVEFVPSLPRTASGKVRRRQLTEPAPMQEFS